MENIENWKYEKQRDGENRRQDKKKFLQKNECIQKDENSEMKIQYLK